MNHTPVIGVLALQGDVAEHLRALENCGVTGRPIKSVADLAGIDGLVIPGGESTTIGMLARREGLLEPLRDAIKAGLPTLGTCAGLIFLADEVIGARSDQDFLGLLHATVRRNAFGRQIDSFESQVEVVGWAEPFEAIFIRAPWIETVGPDAEVLAEIKGDDGESKIVMVRQGNILATAFHPELTDDSRVHEMLCQMVMKVDQGGS